MPTYQFNTQNHLRIWFSNNRDIFLNEENQLRMVRFRQKNPRANLTFVYSSKLLNPEGQEKLKTFCTQHKITPLDFDTALLAECIDEFDKNIYQIAKKELDAYILQKGGNLAAASDLTRLIAPLLVIGTYSDFDTNINVDQLPDVQEVAGPLLLNLGTINGMFVDQHIYINNDIIGVTTKNGQINPDAKELLQRIQKEVIKIYSEGAHKTLERFSHIKPHPQSIIIDYYQQKFFDILFEEQPDIGITDFRFFLDKLTRNIFNAFRMLQRENLQLIAEDIHNRELVSKLISALLNLANDDFPVEFTSNEQDIIKRAFINHIKSSFNSVFDSLRELMLIPGMMSPKAAADIATICQCLKTIDDPDECFRVVQLILAGGSTRILFLKDSVTLFSGPFLFARTLLGGSHPVKHRELSFEKNNLFECFNSGSSLKLGSDPEVLSDRDSKPQDRCCDVSWLSIGQELIQKRENKMQHAAKTIQKAWKDHLFMTKDEPLDGPVVTTPPRAPRSGV